MWYMHYKKFHAVQVTPDIPQNQHSTLCAKNPSTLNNLFYKPNKAVPVLFGKNVIICNKAGFTKSIAYFPVVVGGANATIEVNYVVFTPQKTGRLLLQAACLLWVWRCFQIMGPISDRASPSSLSSRLYLNDEKECRCDCFCNLWADIRIQNNQGVTLVTMMTVFLGYGVRVYHNHRHHRQKNNEKKVGTLFSANFQWNSPFWKQQKWRLWRLWRWFWDRSRTYPANSVISVICVTIVTQEQRGGLGNTPEMRLWISKRYASKTCLPLKRWQTNPIPAQIRICSQEWITSDSSKNLDSKKWISSDSLCTNKWESTFH